MYHLSIKSISRSDGRTATAAAAYRAGAEIADLRTGELHNYKRKGDVLRECSGIVVPAGAPSWAEDRAALWNAAEAAEKRKNSRVARDYEVTIPKELTLAQGVELVRAFAHEISDRYAVAVDFNLHSDDPRTWDGTEKGYQGYHSHILTTTRKLGVDGFGAKSLIEMSDTQRRALGLSDVAGEIEFIRERWEILANRHLELAGQEARIDRRSLKDQGIDREPTVHLGADVTALERKGKVSKLGDINRRVMAEGQERAENGAAIEVVETELAAAKLTRPKRIDLSVLDVSPEPVAEAAAAAQPAALVRATRRPPGWKEILRQREASADVDHTLQELERERRVQFKELLVRGEKRQARRQKALDLIEKSKPASTRELLAELQRDARKQAKAAWEEARLLAKRLLRQAQHLVERMKYVASPERIGQWAQALAEKAWPEAMAKRGQERQQEREREKLEQEEVARQTREQAHAREQGQAQAQAERVRIEAADRAARLARRAEEVQENRERFKELTAAQRERNLALPELRELAGMYDHILEEAKARGRASYTEDAWASLERLRAGVHRKLTEEVYLRVPVAEGLKTHPELKAAYAREEAVERELEGTNANLYEWTQRREEVRIEVVTAIRQTGQYPAAEERLEPVQTTAPAREMAVRAAPSGEAPARDRPKPEIERD